MSINTSQFNPVSRLKHALNVAQFDLPVCRTIASRLSQFTPSLDLKKHIAGDLSVSSVAGEGIAFRPVNVDELMRWFRTARTGGMVAFADPEVADRDNLPLHCSMGATKGTGFREIRGIIMRPNSALAQTSRSEALERALMNRFSASFGEQMDFDISSIHVAIESESKVTMHIDTTGFMLRGFNGLFMSLDAGQHIGNELFWKDMIKRALHRVPGSGWIIDRTAWIWPNSSNGFQTRGPSIRQIGGAAAQIINSTPMLNRLATGGGVSSPGWLNPILDIPVLPGGVSFDMYRTSHSRTQIVLTWSDGFTAVAAMSAKF